MYAVITRWVQGAELYCVVRLHTDGTVAEVVDRTRDRHEAYWFVEEYAQLATN